MVGIYKIESPNGSIYIGQSTDIHKRWKSYYHSQGKNVSLINRSLIKHGFDNHSFSVLHELPIDVSKEVLTIYEQIYMDQFKSCGFKMLNICPAAGSTYGLKATEETRQKQRDAHKNRKPASAETNKKISDFHKGKPKSEATKKKLSESIKGFRHTDEAKLKMSKARKGKKFTDEHRKKISKALMGKKKSAEHIAKRVASIRARTERKKPWSEEARLRQAERTKIFNTNKKLNGL